MTTNFQCVMHGVDYRNGPECGPDCKRMTRAIVGSEPEEEKGA